MSTLSPRASADGPHPADDQLTEGTAHAAQRDLRVILDNVPALVTTVTPTGRSISPVANCSTNSRR
jgi:hypothetical protein